MTDEGLPELRERARRALERSLARGASPADAPADPALLARIEAALRSLPHKRRAIFLAVRLYGTSYAELAETTGLTIRRIEREVARAIAQIDRMLDDRRPDRGWRRLFRLLIGGWHR